jgi:hypothetical protein
MSQLIQGCYQPRPKKITRPWCHIHRVGLSPKELLQAEFVELWLTRMRVFTFFSFEYSPMT